MGGESLLFMLDLKQERAENTFSSSSPLLEDLEVPSRKLLSSGVRFHTQQTGGVNLDVGCGWLPYESSLVNREATV